MIALVWPVTVIGSSAIGFVEYRIFTSSIVADFVDMSFSDKSNLWFSISSEQENNDIKNI